jgi:hypothetical protein
VRKSKFTDDQIAFALKQKASSTPLPDSSPKVGRWRPRAALAKLIDDAALGNVA